MIKVIEQPYFEEKGKMLTEKIEIGESRFKGYTTITQYTPMDSVSRGSILVHESVLKEFASSVCPELKNENEKLKKLLDTIQNLSEDQGREGCTYGEQIMILCQLYTGITYAYLT